MVLSRSPPWFFIDFASFIIAYGCRVPLFLLPGEIRKTGAIFLE
jgi:hypothetical protein